MPIDEHHFDMVTLDDIVKRLDKIESRLDVIARDMVLILSTVNSSQHRVLNSYIRRGSPIPFKPSHDGVP